MKKLPFYNPASPLFFHISVLLLYILIFVLFLVSPMNLSLSIVLLILLFSVLYPLFALGMTILVRGAYINAYQTPVPEEFANELVPYNRLLITVIYISSFIAGLFEVEKTDAFAGLLLLLFMSGLCFLFYLFILPTIIRRLILLKKASFKLEGVILGISFLFSLFGLYIIVRFLY